MKKEYSNTFFMIPAEELPLVIESPYAAFDQLDSDLDIQLEIVPENDNGNTYYSISTEASFEEVDDALKEKYANNRKVAILFKEITTNKIIQVGDQYFPSRVTWSEKNGANLLKLKGFLLSLP